jgi:hypothetical protein
MGQSTQHGVPLDNLALSDRLRGKVNRGKFFRITEPRNRRERRQMDKLDKGKKNNF